MNKKAQFGRVLIGIVVFFVIYGFVNIFSYTLLYEFTEAFDEAGVYNGTAEVLGEQYLDAIAFLDLVTVLLLGIFAVGVVVTSVKVAASPVFFIVQFVAIFFYGTIAFFMNFVFQELVSDTLFDSAKLLFGNTLLITSNLHWVLLVNFVIASITFYAKRERGQFLS